MTAKEIAMKILALPESQQNVPLIIEFYDDSESSVPCAKTINDIRFCETGYPTVEPHIELLDSAW
jgi:hypothetical protein